MIKVIEVSCVYIGKTGKLNQRLGEILNGNISRLLSARESLESKLAENEIVIWGGRYLDDKFLSEYSSKIKIIYISTYIYNDFCDNYQLNKINDTKKIKKIKGKSIDIPFIKDFHNQLLESISSKEESNYITYLTSVENIAELIVKLKNDENVSLKMEKVNLKLNNREKVLWYIFSLLYKKKNKSNLSFSGRLYNNLVKLLEKIMHKILFCHGLSAVYIEKVVINGQY